MSNSCNIILLRHRHFLLKFLKLRAIVNGTVIYEIKEKEPVTIHCSEPVTSIMLTNGFHHSREIKIAQKPGNHFYEIESRIDDVQLLSGLMLMVLFFVIYIVSGVRLFMLFANVPLLLMLWHFYIKRKDFIQIHRLVSSATTN